MIWGNQNTCDLNCQSRGMNVVSPGNDMKANSPFYYCSFTLGQRLDIPWEIQPGFNMKKQCYGVKKNVDETPFGVFT